MCVFFLFLVFFEGGEFRRFGGGSEVQILWRLGAGFFSLYFLHVGGGSVPCFCFFLQVGGGEGRGVMTFCVFKIHDDEALGQEVVY